MKAKTFPYLPLKKVKKNFQCCNDKVKLIISLAHATKDIIIIVHRSTEEIPLKIKKVYVQIHKIVEYVEFVEYIFFIPCKKFC